MRRVAAYIYKKAGRWKQSVGLSKKHNLYSQDLLVYFMEQFILSLYTNFVRLISYINIHQLLSMFYLCWLVSLLPFTDKFGLFYFTFHL